MTTGEVTRRDLKGYILDVKSRRMAKGEPLSKATISDLDALEAEIRGKTAGAPPGDKK